MHQHPLPNATMTKNFTVNALMQATLRLSDILAEESAMIAGMRFKELPSLHDEKMQLTQTLEAYQQVMASNPNFVRDADEKTREELLLLADDLAFSVEENFRNVSTVKAVNSRVMQAIMDVMSEQHRPGTYGRSGQTTSSHDLALSVNLNQKA